MYSAFINTTLFLHRPPLFSTSKSLSPRRPPRRPHVNALLPPDRVEYSREEGLDDPESIQPMTVWNSVIHASLKRKLQGLVAENPVASGVSALMHAAPGYAALNNHTGDSDVLPNLELGKPPEEVVSELLDSLRKDALRGAKAFIDVASERNHVKKSTPQSLVLFVGDNESYRVLLHIDRFSCNAPRWEQSGERCVVTANVWGTAGDFAVFDFQMERKDDSFWLVDEVFRL